MSEPDFAAIERESQDVVYRIAQRAAELAQIPHDCDANFWYGPSGAAHAAIAEILHGIQPTKTPKCA